MCWFYQVCDISCRKRRWKCNDTLPWRQCDDLPRIVFLVYFCHQQKTKFSNISAGDAATLLTVDEWLLSPVNNAPSMLKKKNQGSDVRRIQPSSLSLWGQWEADLWERRSSRSAPECSSISSSAPGIEQNVWRQRDRCIDNPGFRYDSNLNSQTKHVV